MTSFKASIWSNKVTIKRGQFVKAKQWYTSFGCVSLFCLHEFSSLNVYICFAFTKCPLLKCITVLPSRVAYLDCYVVTLNRCLNYLLSLCYTSWLLYLRKQNKTTLTTTIITTFIIIHKIQCGITCVQDERLSSSISWVNLHQCFAVFACSVVLLLWCSV